MNSPRCTRQRATLFRRHDQSFPHHFLHTNNVRSRPLPSSFALVSTVVMALGPRRLSPCLEHARVKPLRWRSASVARVSLINYTFNVLASHLDTHRTSTLYQKRARRIRACVGTSVSRVFQMLAIHRCSYQIRVFNGVHRSLFLGI